MAAGCEPCQDPKALVPVLLCLSEFLSEKGTHLLASSDVMEKNRNSLACLRNAGSYSAQSYCIVCGLSLEHKLALTRVNKTAARLSVAQ